MIGNAGVLAEPHLAGAAIAESLAATGGHLGRQAGEGGGVELRDHQPLVAGKTAALDMLWHDHLPGTGSGHRQHRLLQPHAPAAASDMEHDGLIDGGQLKVGQQVFQHKGGGLERPKTLAERPREQPLHTGAGVEQHGPAPLLACLPQRLGQISTLGGCHLDHPLAVIGHAAAEPLNALRHYHPAARLLEEGLHHVRQ